MLVFVWMFGFWKALLLTGTVVCGFIVPARLLRFSCGPAVTADGTCSLHSYRYQVGEVLLHTTERGAMVQYWDMPRVRGGSQSTVHAL